MKRTFLWITAILLLLTAGCGKNDDVAPGGKDFISLYGDKPFEGLAVVQYEAPDGSVPDQPYAGRGSFRLENIREDDVTLSFGHDIPGLEAFVLAFPGRQQGKSWYLQLEGVQGSLMVREDGTMTGQVGDNYLEYTWNGKISAKELRLEVIGQYLQAYDGLPAGTIVKLSYELRR